MRSPAKCHPDKPVHGHGWCNSCYMKFVHPREDPVKNRERSRRYYYANREKCAAATRERYTQRKSEILRRAKAYVLKTQFGLTLEQFNEYIKAQNGLCAICGKPPKKKQLAVDHIHGTKIVRGLLCVSCNRVLGFMDNPEWLAKARAYQDRGRFLYEHLQEREQTR